MRNSNVAPGARPPVTPSSSAPGRDSRRHAISGAGYALALTVAVLSACTEDRASAAYDPFGGADTAGGDGAAADPEALTPILTIRSVTLKCGGSCGGDFAARCDDDVAVFCHDGSIVCDDCAATSRTCTAGDGDPKCLRAGEGEEICTGDGCFTRICEPLATWCERGAVHRCDDTGQFEEVNECQLGLDCRDAQCLPAQPYAVILFDTSDSMNWMPNDDDPPPGIIDYPACDDPNAPQTRIGIAKAAFSKLFSDPRYQGFAFALMRFPQILDAGAKARCMAGSYLPENTVTGHSGVFTTGAWFDAALHEVLVVPFPNDATGNQKVLASWLDFNEEIDIDDTVCTAHADCPGGLCTAPGGQGKCRYLLDPELRAALGATPLGTTLFYAGEYFRKFVVREGQPCQLDADCLTTTQFCVEGRCHDPNRFCRRRSVVVFSDGADTASLQPFYDPVVQARRLRAGLSCATESDCGRGFGCDDGTCQKLEGGCGVSASCDRSTSKFAKATELGSDRLRDANGDPFEVTVHVVDVSGSFGTWGDNRGMSEYGGGLFVSPELASPDTLFEGLRGVIDWKDADFCDD
ncbi:MAG: hypothetical protein IV100_31095 [Myxococcales bacterium]|nr:hypothetical protein [Myxococcales bacterium]